MKKIALFVSILFIGIFYSLEAQSSKISIIPQPASLIEKPGNFMMSNSTLFLSNESPAVQDFYAKMRQLFPQNATDNVIQSDNTSKVMFITGDKSLGEEGYSITISQQLIEVKAFTETGFFYAIQTLYQMMPVEVYGNKKIKETEFAIPCCEIIDYPRFPYRGSHLDVCRHFFDVNYVKKHIELLSMYKINYFHWHLTDDQGWRIEIKQYPKLQEIASQRKETWIGHYNSGLGYDGVPYGGYYTQEEIKEVVAYAAAHHVTIIPEIEIPGHALAALAAYPELSCTGGPHEVACTWGVFDDVFCPKEATFTFLENVLDEVIALFPDAPYIHIGGDECPKTRWKECPSCQARIKENGLKDEHELQGYFMNRIAKYVESKGKKAIAWDEALEGGVSKDVVIMSWQGEIGGINAANLGNYSIMTPSAYLYLNFYQGDPENEPLSIGGFVPLSKVYNYDPIPKELPKDKHHFILGAQGNLWAEYIKDTDGMEYMGFPRLCAVAEITWTPLEKKNYDNFLQRLNQHFNILDIKNVNYSKSHFNIVAKTGWNENAKKPEITLTSPCIDCEIYYSLNDSTFPLKHLYTKPIIINDNSRLFAAVYKNKKLFSSIYKENFIISKSTGKHYIMKDINPQYNGGHELALTDGILGNLHSWNKWVGTLDHHLDVVIDLEEIELIKNIEMQFVHSPGSWIFAPINVSILISNDNLLWEEISTKDLSQYQQTDKQQIVDVNFILPKELTARYIKVKGTSILKCPEGHPGAGYGAHLFINEIIIK